MKKFLSLVLALVMTMSLVTISAGAKDFNDADEVTYTEAVDVVSTLGIVDGDKAGNINAKNGLTRGAAAKIICNLILGPTTAAELNADTNPYPDVDKNSTFAGYIAYCQKEGIISGYADGTFKAANPLTGYAFMKMLLGALGYESAQEGYTGANWSINVAKQAIGIGLNKGLLEDFNGSDYVTREEAMLYSLNTLKATMVEYEQKTVVTVADAQVALTGNAQEVSWGSARMNDGNIKYDGFVQFAEKYFANLEKDPTTDAFGRPATEWVLKNESIGTYVNYDEMVAEYTTAVTGKEIYDVLGKTAVDTYEINVMVDGNDESSSVAPYIVKKNKADLGETGKGVLTQVFINNDDKTVTVSMINTYLAIATKDYNEKRDEVSFDVYAMADKGRYLEKTLTASTDKVDLDVSGEDFDIVDVLKDDVYLVTVAEKAIQTLVPAEVVADATISAFAVDSKVVSDGETYEYNTVVEYDPAVLAAWTDGTTVNLKEKTYNLYLDGYGYLIGVEEVDPVDNYVFITGADGGNSNLATKATTANAIFVDGTSAVIDVNTTKGNPPAENAIINEWFTYTVDKNGVYTLYSIPTDIKGVKVAQYEGDDKVVEIDKKHVSLPVSGDFSYVYGNDSTVYLTADLKEVHNRDYYAVIAGVENVTTGVKNASILTYDDNDVMADYSNVENGVQASSGFYALYKDNGYVIAAVVVGEDAAASKNLVYAHTSGVALESYDDAEGEWTWTRKVIFEGEEIEITEKGDSLTEIGPGASNGQMTQYGWYQVKYDAAGNVVEVEPAATELGGPNKYITMFSQIETAVNAEDTVLFDTDLTGTCTLVGSTLYGNTAGIRGLFIAEDAKIVMIQKNDNKQTTTYDVGVDAVEEALEDLNAKANGSYDYELSAIIEEGAATVVVIYDKVDGVFQTGTPNTGSTTGISVKVVDEANHIVYLNKAEKAAFDAANQAGKEALVKSNVNVALFELGYTWSTWTTTGTWTVTTTNTNSNNAANIVFTISWL